MRTWIAVIATALVLSACGSTEQGSDNSEKAAEPKTDPNRALIEKRYGDCLDKLDAKFDQGGPRLYAYDVSGGRYLVFTTGKMNNGKTMTAPKEPKDIALLESVGC